jgi:hypothetical protein
MLRIEMIPRGVLIESLERELGQRITHDCRHYLDDQPVHCGEILELYKGGQWVTGRYEWTGVEEERPFFFHDGGVAPLDEISLLRWPER